MNLRHETWYPAIFHRLSRRTFLDRPIEADKVSRIDEVCREFRPFAEARVEFVPEGPTDVFKGIIGHYGRITGAPAYFVVIGDMESPRAQECAGYLGEAAILEATAMGLGTCWVGGMFRPGPASARIRIEGAEKILSVIPVGYAAESFSPTDKLFRGLAGSAKRKSLHQLVVGGDLARFPWIETSIEAARMAPSAANRQPWRFRIEEGGFVVRLDTDRDRSAVSRRLDCGIAMLHAELGARAAGVAGRWEFLDTPEVARFIAQA